jgi:hypothetical protein
MSELILIILIILVLEILGGNNTTDHLPLSKCPWLREKLVGFSGLGKLVF